MKNLIIISLFFVLYFGISNAQTNVNIPGPENVLVVYKVPSDSTDSLGIVSQDIMLYYKNARNIPSSNIVPLELPRRIINLDDGTGDHVVKLAYNNEHIQDSTWAEVDSISYVAPKFHAWLYFLEEMADPIRLHLENNNLTGIIRYIVMCQGVPYKIQSRGDHSTPTNQSIDGLLCMLNTDNYDNFIQDVYDQYYSQPGGGYGSPFLWNPYWDKDSTFNFDSRFFSDYYSGSWSGHTYKLSYLISRLDGLNYNIITSMIDKSVNADKSGENTWILDGGSHATSDADTTNFRLNKFNFIIEYDNSIDDWIVSSQNTVVGYLSPGTWQNMPVTYIQDTLDFNYANGSVFNTYESYNGNSIGTLRRVAGSEQGLMTEFTLTGGTAGVAHTHEPFASKIIKSYVYFPYYAMGYNQIDAAWQGAPVLAWRNVVVGDPLTTIAWGKQELKDDLTWSGTNLVTGEVTIPGGKTLTLEEDIVINLKHEGFITGYGLLIVGERFTFNTTYWDKSLFRTVLDSFPRFVWGDYPSGIAEGYNVWRRLNLGDWILLAGLDSDAREFADTTLLLGTTQGNLVRADYRVEAVGRGFSEFSNIVEYKVQNPFMEKQKSLTGQMHAYSLSENYPNPFNPSTTIKYSIKEDGLVSIKVYNILGSEVASIVNETKMKGDHTVVFNASNLASGTYIYMLRVNDYTAVKKMLLLK
jgi:uncharacterized protein (TIGR03790 family)